MAENLATPHTPSSTMRPLPETNIREVFMALDGVNSPIAVLGARLVSSLLLAPIGFLLLGPLFALKFAPFLCKRYTLTNRRLLIQRGWKPAVSQEIALSEIRDVHLDETRIDTYFLSAELRILGDAGKILLTLPSVPEPAGFRLAILDAARAYGVSASKVIGPFKAAGEAK